MAGEIFDLKGGSMRSTGDGEIEVTLGDFVGKGPSPEVALAAATLEKYPQPPQPKNETGNQWHDLH